MKCPRCGRIVDVAEDVKVFWALDSMYYEIAKTKKELLDGFNKRKREYEASTLCARELSALIDNVFGLILDIVKKERQRKLEEIKEKRRWQVNVKNQG